MINGTTFFNPTQFTNGFTPFWNSGFANPGTGSWNTGFVPFTGFHPELHGNFVPQYGFQGNTYGVPFNGYTPNLNTYGNYPGVQTPWNTISPFSGIGFGGNPTTGAWTVNGQFVPSNTGPYGYNTINAIHNSPFTGSTPTNTWNGPTTQPWNTFGGYSPTGYTGGTPFTNYGGTNFTNGYVPQWNGYGTNSYFNPTATFPAFLSTIAGTPTVNPAFFHPAMNIIPGNYVNGIPFNPTTGYPITNTGPINTGTTTDVNGRVQTGTIGLARNAA